MVSMARFWKCWLLVTYGHLIIDHNFSYNFGHINALQCILFIMILATGGPAYGPIIASYLYFSPSRMHHHYLVFSIFLHFVSHNIIIYALYQHIGGESVNSHWSNWHRSVGVGPEGRTVSNKVAIKTFLIYYGIQWCTVNL